jgi:hypothetical protein
VQSRHYVAPLLCPARIPAVSSACTTESTTSRCNDLSRNRSSQRPEASIRNQGQPHFKGSALPGFPSLVDFAFEKRCTTFFPTFERCMMSAELWFPSRARLLLFRKAQLLGSWKTTAGLQHKKTGDSSCHAARLAIVAKVFARLDDITIASDVRPGLAW